MHPVPILIVGPSGVGKSTIIEEIVAKFPLLERFATTTTRPPRDAQDTRYHFVSKPEFEQMLARKEFIESTETHGNCYGTERRVIEKVLARGKYPVPGNAIDIKGVESYKKHFPHLLAIFIAYESLNELPSRLRKTRPHITETEIKIRMETAQQEMNAATQFKHVVVNKEGHLDDSVRAVTHILRTELGIQPIAQGEHL